MSIDKRLINVEGPQGVEDGFSSVAYDGNSSSQTLNTGLQSGIFWARSRTTARNYFTYNISGGNPGKYVVPSSTQIEEGTGSSISYNSTNIGLTYSFGWNYNSISYLGITWGFPTSGSTNSNGSITTTTYADQSLGQSMFTYTGTGNNATIGHGLSSAPEFVVIKTRSHVSDWPVYHSGLSGNNYRIKFNSDSGEDTSNNPWNSTAPTSSVISIKGTAGNVNQSSRTFWGWAFHSVANHCKVGTYTGSGSSQTINIGFQPNHVWIKRRNGTDNWALFDSNRANKVNYINSDTGEESFTFGFASNGFTVPSTSGMTNGSGQTYLYCAWKHSI